MLLTAKGFDLADSLEIVQEQSVHGAGRLALCAVAAMRGLVPGRVFLGGQSYGGRQASVLAAEDGAVTEGLLLLSYPLHPPGRPQQARTSHWPVLRVPALFVHGSRDSFASSEELRAAVTLIPALSRIVEIEGAGHDLRRGAWNTAELVVEPFLELMGR